MIFISFNFREYPVSGGLPGNTHRPEDKQNYVLLLKELRRQLDAVPNKTYLLTVAYVKTLI
jgi:chitinase